MWGRWWGWWKQHERGCIWILHESGRPSPTPTNRAACLLGFKRKQMWTTVYKWRMMYLGWPYGVDELSYRVVWYIYFKVGQILYFHALWFPNLCTTLPFTISINKIFFIIFLALLIIRFYIKKYSNFKLTSFYWQYLDNIYRWQKILIYIYFQFGSFVITSSSKKQKQ